MRPLKSYFPAHALTTLETILKQTKEARVFRRAQAVHAVVAGQHVSAVSTTFHLANSALRKWVQRFAHEGPQGLLDRPRSGRPPSRASWNNTSIASSIKTPWSTALSIPNGVVANSPPCWPTRPGSNSAVKVCAGC
jgi:Helix-turn-helix domain